MPSSPKMIHALYIPMESAWSVTAETDLELAVCSAPGGGTYEAKAIPPGTHPPLTRGKGTNVRHVNNIMNSAFAPSQTTTQDSQGTLISAIFHILLIVYRSAEHFIDQGKTPGN